MCVCGPSRYATRERDALTESDVHRSVDHRPITRYEVAGGYTAAALGQEVMPMKWVTRARPKTDRIACPWLIRRFIDPDAEILYVPTDQVLAVAEREGAHGFDTPGAEYDHRGNKCTFEVLIDDYDLAGDPALMRLARIVHAADIESEIDTDPFAPRCSPSAFGGLDVEADDHRLLERAVVRVRRASTPGAQQQVAAGAA